MPRVRLTVITNRDGKVVGTKQIVDPGAALAPTVSYRPATQPEDSPTILIPVYSQLVAGPDQEAHEVDIDLPEKLFQSLDPAALHEMVQVKLEQLKGK